MNLMKDKTPPPPFEQLHNYSTFFQNNRPIDWDVSQVQVQVNFALFKWLSHENAFKQKKKKPWLKFNSGLALIGLRTTGPRFVDMCTETKVAESFRVFKFSSVLLDSDLV